MRILFAFIWFFCLSSELKSQKVICFGKITDSSGTELEFVSIINITSKASMTSGVDGSYHFLCGVDDSILFKLLGYKSYTVIAREIVDEKTIVLEIDRVILKAITVDAQKYETIGYQNLKKSNKYIDPQFRQNTIIQSYIVEKENFKVLKFQFFLTEYDTNINLRIRVTIGNDKEFANATSYSITKTNLAQNSFIDFDFSSFEYEFLEKRVYFKIELLDNGIDLCKDNSKIGLVFANKKQNNIVTYLNNYRWTDGEFCWLANTANRWTYDLMSKIEISY